jgi:hypothetical protein
MKKSLITLTIMLAAAAMIAAFSCPVQAAVTGPCANCHTMHNSQGGANMAVDETNTLTTTAYAHLTMSSCVGCHFKALGEDNTFVGAGDIPGLTGSMNHTYGSTDPNDLTCAGSNGCHGQASVAGNDAGIKGFHHGSVSGWRYLQIANGGAAVVGVGAADWEKAMSDGWNTGDEHNVYSSSTSVGINKLCANCHPNFHGTANTQDVNSDWIRHPTDNDIPAAWSAVVDYRDNPFAFADPIGSSMLSTGTYTATNAQVACISCHRAHGTPYDDILRWDYSTQVAGGGYVAGCLGCHTLQD